MSSSGGEGTTTVNVRISAEMGAEPLQRRIFFASVSPKRGLRTETFWIRPPKQLLWDTSLPPPERANQEDLQGEEEGKVPPILWKKSMVTFAKKGKAQSMKSAPSTSTESRKKPALSEGERS